MNSVSVVIRNKNQATALEFLLKNLTERYFDDIQEIIVIDNLSTDGSVDVANKYGAKLVTIENFSYGGSANLAASSASNNIVVIFSAHAYPVSHDFFKQIIKKFNENPNLSGVRCLHNKNDYKSYINKISSNKDPNVSGLIFCGSAFSKTVWNKHPFKNDIRTMEDKEWTVRVLKNGYDVEFAPAIFCYDIKRNNSQNFFRFKNELVGGYQLWHTKHSYGKAFKELVGSIINTTRNSFSEFYYAFKKFFFTISFLRKKPEKFQ